MRFAQIVDGRVTNPCDGDDVAQALAKSFAPGFVAIQGAGSWVQIPDDAPANACLDGHGGWTAPETPEAASEAPAETSVSDIAARLAALTTTVEKIAAKLNVE